MTEHELKACIKVVHAYFVSVSGEAPITGLPYVKTTRNETSDYTGVIGISGNRRGGVYLTAPRDLLKDFARCILDEENPDDDVLWDMVGEMTNTVAGNMREIFGYGFLISVPIIMKGRVEDIMMRLKPPVFIIPLTWRGHSCQLAVGLE